MLNVTIETVAGVAVIRCSGRIVRSDAAYLLREAVISQIGARAIVLDLTAVQAIEGGGLGMLVFLQRLTRDYGTPFKFFNPSAQVREKLQRVASNLEVDIASIPSVVALASGDEKPPTSMRQW
jgi:anti-anti-sigma regulatory factor